MRFDIRENIFFRPDNEGDISRNISLLKIPDHDVIYLLYYSCFIIDLLIKCFVLCYLCKSAYLNETFQQCWGSETGQC